jgi:hypothetical protein
MGYLIRSFTAHLKAKNKLNFMAERKSPTRLGNKIFRVEAVRVGDGWRGGKEKLGNLVRI